LHVYVLTRTKKYDIKNTIKTFLKIENIKNKNNILKNNFKKH